MPDNRNKRSRTEKTKTYKVPNKKTKPVRKGNNKSNNAKQTNINCNISIIMCNWSRSYRRNVFWTIW